MTEKQFTIIDGNDDYLEKKPAFVEIYNENEYTIPEICEKLQLTRNEYKRLRKHCNEEGLITLRKRRNKKKRTYKTHPKNYSRLFRRGNIYFHIYKDNEYYTCCSTKQQAEEIVEKLKACNWDKKQINRIKEEVVNNAK